MREQADKNERGLKDKLDKEQYMLLFYLIDAKDMIGEEASISSFVAGLKIGIKMGCELHKE